MTTREETPFEMVQRRGREAEARYAVQAIVQCARLALAAPVEPVACRAHFWDIGGIS